MSMSEIIISYEPFFRYLKERGISQNYLLHVHDLSHGMLDRMRKGGNMTLVSIGELLKTLQETDLNKIVEIHIP